MRIPLALAVLVLVPSPSLAQNKELQDAIEQKLATIRYVLKLQASTGEFYPSAPGPRSEPSLRATSAAVRSLKYLTGKKTADAVPNVKGTAAFVMSCYDSKTGGFADTPGGKPDVAITAVGVMAAVELEIHKEKFAKAMDYLKENAKTFEDVRIGAAAVEAWGVKDCPFDVMPWATVAREDKRAFDPNRDDEARFIGSAAALRTRLGDGPPKDVRTDIVDVLNHGQRDDGGWGNKKDEKASDLESSYRVMRAFYLLKEKPKDTAKLREFIGKCRNKDGGYGVKPGEASTAGGVYFATIITKWLDEMEKK